MLLNSLQFLYLPKKENRIKMSDLTFKDLLK
jgi:hypothetical protein